MATPASNPKKAPKPRGPRRTIAERRAEAESRARNLALQEKLGGNPILRAAVQLERAKTTGRKEVDSLLESARGALRQVVKHLGS